VKLKFVWIGKTRNAPMKDLIGDYLGRLERFARVEIIELRDQAGVDAGKIIEKEGEEIIARVEGDQFIVALDERGRQMSSFELSEFIEKHQISGTKQITFVIGGHGGLAESVRRRSDRILSLSSMTLTHEMARVLLIEQLYRAYTILHDLPYQK
jgi:23S rRNA (pseudouridine1915-N3)-methyltransferase